MAPQAIITLTAEHGNVMPPVRTIVLEPGSPTAPVGRASKSISKGLFSAADNAWFDSPVMSRDHARITMDAENKTINIQDIGSMHGTYLNGIELARHVPSTLNNGDILVFGAEVRRGPETFPACSFRISYEFADIMATNTYSFPESSDIDDMEEGDGDGDGDKYPFSEDDDARRKQQSSEDGVSIESTSPKTQKINDAIDLTRDDSPEECNRIDLTGDTPSEKGIMDTLAGRVTDIDHRAGRRSLDLILENAPILVDSDEEEARNSIDSAEQSEDASSDSGDSEGSNMLDSLDEEISQATGDSEADSVDMAMDGTFDAESLHGFSDIDEEEVPVSSNFSGYVRPAHHDPTVLLSDIRTRTQFPESVADDDDEDEDDGSEFGLSEAGEAGLRALMDGGLLQGETNASSEQDPESDSENEPEPESDNENEKEPDVPAAPALDGSAETAAPSSVSELPPLHFAKARYATLQNFTGDKLGISYSIIRQPSPSDAAMVKSAAPQQPVRTPVGVCEVGSFGKPSAQTLGDKTGKTAFFEAREINKAKFGGPAMRPARGFGQSMTPVPSLSPARPITRRPGSGFGSSFASFSKVTPNPEPDLGPPFPTREPCSFLDKPDQSSVPPRTPSPFDMTSAFNFQISKNTTTTQSPLQANPRGIKINDIIDTSATPQRPLRNKRKADEISDATDKELRIWAKSSPAPSVTKITLERRDNKTQAITKTGVAAIPAPAAPASATPHISEARPAKRMKKLLENVGYAALGGVAVGAGLFTVLVATAPDFL